MTRRQRCISSRRDSQMSGAPGEIASGPAAPRPSPALGVALRATNFAVGEVVELPASWFVGSRSIVRKSMIPQSATRAGTCSRHPRISDDGNIRRRLQLTKQSRNSNSGRHSTNRSTGASKPISTYRGFAAGNFQTARRPQRVDTGGKAT